MTYGSRSPVVSGEGELPISESSVKTPEIGPGGVHVPSGILTGPREILRQELGDPDGARGISSESVKSRFFVELATKEVSWDAVLDFRFMNDGYPFLRGSAAVPHHQSVARLRGPELSKRSCRRTMESSILSKRPRFSPCMRSIF